MSLHQLAQHIQSQGRGDDKMLVHMTPGEVHGLQALAMAHGGSLTINPETGLPEAGWLSKLLPAVAGLALNAFAPGVGTAIGAALGGLSGAAGTGILVGGISALASGSLKEGLMAGIGAYGGANLGTALSSAAPAATTTGVSPAVTASSNLVPNTAQELTAAGLSGPATTAAGAAAPASAQAGLQGVVGGQGVLAPSAGAAASQQAANTATAEMLARREALRSGMSPLVSSGSGASAGVGAGTTTPTSWDNMKAGWETINKTPETLKDFAWQNKGSMLAAAAPMFDTKAVKPKMPKQYIRPYTFTRTPIAEESDVPFNRTSQMRFYDSTFTPHEPYVAPGPEYKATGGIVALAGGGSSFVPTAAPNYQNGTTTTQSTTGISAPASPKKQKSVIPTYQWDPVARKFIMLSDSTGAATGQDTVEAPAPSPATATQIANMYASQLQRPPTRAEIDAGLASGITTKDLRSQLVGGDEYINNLTKPFVPRVSWDEDTNRASVEGALTPYRSPAEQLGLTDFYSQMNAALAKQLGQVTGLAQGGRAMGGMEDGDLGGYSDGGRLLRGPGNGTSDSIPAIIGSRQPARLAEGEFVIPARIVSELGNGSTDAGAKQLYAMMDRVQRARRKTTGKNKVAFDAKARSELPA